MSVKNSTISEKIAQLGELVTWFESDEFVLEDAAERFEAAKKLADEIEQSLETMKNDIRVIKQNFDEK